MIGITPHALTYRTEGLGHFMNFINVPRQDIYFDIHLAAILNFIDPMSFRDAYLGLFPGLAPTHTRKEYFEDGWIAVHKEPSGKRREVKRYMGLFKRSQVSQKTIDVLLEFVRRWNSSGIKIYGFMVPTCKEMVELETNSSGFNQPEFIKAFDL